ncbi:hypothetical protein GPECTOR_180g252 [Gonium pectorale]|uniref:Uncharacterized protein n=1 Tax=Gonium pectorale TaxID=33097 RepID=A0A150FX87_GONPE|nr:hypothetical protein GPECTOR_180g252 [Gonium pectorale]|eukprot:KXZ42216.1 hypothetical protein GPECTOR_180g252 [Gonium pectorale]
MWVGGAGDSAAFSASELSSVEGELAAWIAKTHADPTGGTPGTWAAVGEKALPALIAFYAIVLRRSCAVLEPAVSESMREAYSRVRAKLSSELSRIRADMERHLSPGMARRIALAVLRSQAVRVQSCLLADAAAQLDRQAQGPGRRSRRVIQAAVEAVTEAGMQLAMYQTQADAEWKENSANFEFPLNQDLRAELLASGILVQLSRLLLLLAACEGWQDEAAKQLHSFSNLLNGLDKPDDGHGGGVVDGPGAAALVSSSLRSLFRRVIRAARGGGGGTAGREIPAGALEAAERGCRLAGAPPLHSAAAFELSMRVATAAVRVMAAAAAAGDLERLPAGHLIQPTAAPELASQALRCGWWALGEEAVAAAAVDTATADRMQCWWRMLVVAVDAAEMAEPDERGDKWFRHSWDGLGRYFYLPPLADERAGKLPAAPSPWVAAALRAGFVSRALVMMRAHRYSKRWHMGLMGLVRRLDQDWAWGQLFAFGSPRKTVAMVGIVAEQLREAMLATPEPAGGARRRADPAALGKLAEAMRDAWAMFRLPLRLRPRAARDAVASGAGSRGSGAGGGSAPTAGGEGLGPEPHGVQGDGGGSAAAGSGDRGASSSSGAGSGVGGAGGSGTRAAGSSGGGGGAAEAPGPEPVEDPSDGPAANAAAAGKAAESNNATDGMRFRLLLSYVCTKLVPLVSEALLCRYLPSAAHEPPDERASLQPMLVDLLDCATMVAAALRRSRHAKAAAEAAEAAASGAGPAGGAAEACEGASTEWRQLLMDSLRLPALLAEALRLVHAGDCGDRAKAAALQAALRRGVQYLAALVPEELAEAMLTGGRAALTARPSPVRSSGGGRERFAGALNELIHKAREDNATCGAGRNAAFLRGLAQLPWMAEGGPDVGSQEELDSILLVPRAVEEMVSLV